MKGDNRYVHYFAPDYLNPIGTDTYAQPNAIGVPDRAASPLSPFG